MRGRLAVLVLVVIMVFSASTAARAEAVYQPTYADDSYQAVQDALDMISTLALDELPYSELAEAAIRGAVAATGDRYSHYLPPSDFESFVSETEGGYYGIGVTVEAGAITGVRPGGPADQAGLRVGDVLVSIDGYPTEGMSLGELRDRLRGADGTSVDIVVERGGVQIAFTVVRAWIRLETVEHRVIGGYQYGMGYNIGYIRITEFSETTPGDVEAAISHLLDANAVDTIIDLRDNPGGLIGSAAAVADLFIDSEAPITHLYGRAVYGGTIQASLGGKRGRIVVLVNRNSASAAEILAAALKESAGATVVGEQTFGKGRFQYLLPLSNGGAISLTVGMFLTPNGNAIDGKGVSPQVEVADPRFVLLPETPLDPHRTLKQGMVGLDVLALQEQLRFLGYAVGEPDGVFSAATAAVVKSFQKDAGLKADGIATEAVQTAALRAVPKPPAGDPILDAGISVLTGR